MRIIGPYLLAFVFAVIFLGAVRLACNEHETPWHRFTGLLVGAMTLVLLLAISRSL